MIILFQGIRGFWRGVTASYWGISETVIHFVIYEYLKSQLAAYQNKHKDATEKTFYDFAGVRPKENYQKIINKEPKFYIAEIIFPNIQNYQQNRNKIFTSR